MMRYQEEIYGVSRDRNRTLSIYPIRGEQLERIDEPIREVYSDLGGNLPRWYLETLYDLAEEGTLYLKQMSSNGESQGGLELAALGAA